MRRFAFIVTLAALLFAPLPGAAQSDAPRVYISYLKLDFADMDAMIEGYQEVEVPVLDALVEEGILTGYGLATHDTGGEYNLRMVLATPNWDALGDFWDAYFARLPEDYVASVMSMIRGHTDEIWVIGEMAQVEGADPPGLLYESAWEIAYDQIEGWTADFDEYGRPALQRAMNQGLITGWVRLDHDTGPWNVKYVYWLTEWDAYDDVAALLAEGRTEMDPEMMRAPMAHEDHIWRMVPTTGGN